MPSALGPDAIAGKALPGNADLPDGSVAAFEIAPGLDDPLDPEFPLGGFILESRGGRSYVRISIGRRNRVEMDQHCKIFRRIRKESQDSENNLIQVTDFDLLGKMQIFNIQEDFSWGRVETEARKKILKGDAVRCY